MAQWARKGKRQARYHDHVVQLCSLSKVGQPDGRLRSGVYVTGHTIADSIDGAVEALAVGDLVNVPNDRESCAAVRQAWAGYCQGGDMYAAGVTRLACDEWQQMGWDAAFRADLQPLTIAGNPEMGAEVQR